MKTKSEIIEIAKKQLMLDSGCSNSDFDKSKITILEKKYLDGRRIYQYDDCFFKTIIFGDSVIISTNSEMIPWCKERYINGNGAWFFQYSNLKAIDIKLMEFGHEVKDAHHYYLPNPNSILDIEVPFDIKWYESDEILEFENDDRFDEAFAFNKNFPDVLGIAAIEDNKIIGMAGASADSKTMWQIGINVLPEYKGRGIGTKLVILLKNEILKRGKIPFYGTVESHIFSQNVALQAGFFPAWAELYSRRLTNQ